MKIAILGCGHMGTALVKRLSQQHQLFLYDSHFEKSAHLENEGYGKACSFMKEALQNSEIIILAIKLQSLNEVADEINGHLTPSQTVISLLAGTPIASIKQYFPNNRLIRMMPNLPVEYGEGLIALASEGKIPKEESEPITEMCESLGLVYWIPESKIDAFTALASSGPAFMLAIIEAMVESGIGMGFHASDSRKIVLQMIKGTLLMLEKTSKHPGELKWQVSSPGGTTIAGLRTLEEQGVRSGIINTFLAAYRRAQEISESL